jgi:hypothetical protein
MYKMMYNTVSRAYYNTYQVLPVERKPARKETPRRRGPHSLK